MEHNARAQTRHFDIGGTGGDANVRELVISLTYANRPVLAEVEIQTAAPRHQRTPSFGEPYLANPLRASHYVEERSEMQGRDAIDHAGLGPGEIVIRVERGVVVAERPIFRLDVAVPLDLHTEMIVEISGNAPNPPPS